MTRHLDVLVAESHPGLAASDVAAIEPLAADVLRRLGPLLGAAGLTGEQVRCRIVPRQLDLDIHLDVDGPADRGLDQSLAVRALDAVHGDPRRFGHVGVHVHHTT